jgi:hypothetical protein
MTPSLTPQENELPIESRCQCLKPEPLKVHTILQMQNIITNNVHNLGSSAQNHTGYIKTFVTSQYLNTPSPQPICHTSSQKSQLPPPSECDVIHGHLGNNNAH